MRCSSLLVALWLSLPSAAHADRVPAPPDDCPRGSVGHTEHAGPWCAATTCTSDEQCNRDIRPDYFPEGTRLACREVALCVVTERYQLGHHTPEPEFSERTVARGACIEGRCPAGGTCETARRCVVDDAPAEPATPTTAEAASPETPAASPEDPAEETTEEEAQEEEERGGCGVSRGTASGWTGLGLLVLALALRARRRSAAR